MVRQLTITAEPIDEAALLAQRARSPDTGAVVYFLGVVRGTEEHRAISAIEYEAFVRMAEHQFNLLFDQMETMPRRHRVSTLSRRISTPVNVVFST